MNLSALPIATLAGPLGVAVTVALVAVLFLREVLPGAGGKAVRRWRFGLSIATALLLVPFAAFVVARIAIVSAPTIAASFPATATSALATGATPAVAQPASAATPRVVPTATPVASPRAAAPATIRAATPTPGAPVRVANAIGGLRTGQFEVEIRYANAARSTSIVYFDLGTATRPPRLHSWTTYQGTTGSIVTERIVIGDQSWTRQPGAAWSLATTAQGVAQEIGPFMPSPGAALSAATPDGAGVLHWYDPARDADLRLALDPATDLPVRLEQTTRSTGLVMAVTYRGWNVLVVILPPTDR